MSDRYEITFEEGGVGVIETVLTGGLAPIAQNALDKLTSDSNHGWHCYIYDRSSRQKGSGFGWSKALAQEHAFENLKENIEAEEEGAERERREQELERQRQRELQQSYSRSTGSDENVLIQLVGKLLGILLLGFIIVWLISNVVLPLLIMDIAIISLGLGYFNEKLRKILYTVSILGAILFIFDYNLGWSSHRFASHVTFLAGIVPVLYVANIGAGLVSCYLLIINYLKTAKPEFLAQPTKKNLVIVGHVLLGAILLGFQFIKTESRASAAYRPSKTVIKPAQDGPREEAKQINSSGSTTQNINQDNTKGINNSYLFPIDNLFNAWSGLNFTLYMSQWDQNAAQYSKQFKTRTYQDIFQNRKSLFDRLSSVQVLDYKVLSAQNLDNNKSINIEYSMKYYFKNGKVVNESNVSEKYVLRYDDANRQWLILENYDYIN